MSFFAKVPGGVEFAAIMLGLVVVQIFLGIFGHESAFVGALHVLNAFLLLGSAVSPPGSPGRPASDDADHRSR